jgi:penicillin-binding protein 2
VSGAGGAGGGGRRPPDPGRPRPVKAPYFPLDEPTARPRVRISSASSLKRLEDQEREQQRRQESARFGLRLTVMGLVILALFSGVVFRLWSLQVLQSAQYKPPALAEQTRDVPIVPTRGLIEARGGQVLVANQIQPVVTLSQISAKDHPGVIGRLAALLGQSPAQVTTEVNNPQALPYQPVPVASGVDSSVVVYLAEHRGVFPGVKVTYLAERTYPQRDLAAHLLGYVGDINSTELAQLRNKGYSPSDQIGQSGVESSFEQWLRGTPGSQVIKVDANGNPVGVRSTTAAKPGSNVVLTVDLGLQQTLESALGGQIAALQAHGLPSASGGAVVLDPQNGNVLAMASFPTYNPSWWVGGISNQRYQELTRSANHDPLLNRAMQGLWAPGSTFKLATATAALNDGLISQYSYLPDPGYYKVQNCTGKCTFYNNQHESLGEINVTTAITASDDVFFYTLGADFWSAYQNNGHYGPAPIQSVAAQYGFGQLTGIDLPGEYAGQLDSPALRTAQNRAAPKAFPSSYYGIGDNINMAFGQGETLITPLQLATAYGTFANGGTRYAPQVAAAAVSPTGRVTKTFGPKVLSHVSLPPSTYQSMLAGFEGAITSSGATSPQGTAYGAFQGYNYAALPIAGKTGTATESNNPSTQPTALFVAWGPVAPAKARYVVAVVIDQAGYGASAAAPVARQVFEYLIAHPIGAPDLKVPATAQ